MKIAIIGLGYVGLPLAIAFSKQHEVIGFDINGQRVQELQAGIDKTKEIEPEQLIGIKNLTFSSDLTDIGKCVVYIITVPTPINHFKSPDINLLLKASAMIGLLLKKGDLVIYESTVYPGCTEEDCVPELEQKSGLTYNVDFFCGYSPERINPGDKKNTLASIKKVTSGSTPEIATKVDDLYKEIITAGTFKVASIKVAEASKAIENAQRDLNISFVNELAYIFDRMGIDTQEVLEAAATKWNFLNFKPGLVGGHCIGVDPYYLAHKAESLGYYPQVILSGRRVNDYMGIFVANKVVRLLIGKSIPVHQAKALVLGITFKENCPDTRNSRVIDVIQELKASYIQVDVFDPHADTEAVKTEFGIDLISKIEGTYEAIILCVAHDEFLPLNFSQLKSSPNAIIYDTKAIWDKTLVDGRL